MIAWFWVVYYIVMILVTLYSAYVAYSTAQRVKKMKLPKFDDGGGGYLANTRSTEEVIPVIYGRYRVSGYRIY